MSTTLAVYDMQNERRLIQISLWEHILEIEQNTCL